MDTTGTSVPQCPPFLCFLYCFVQKLADRNGFLLLSCLKRFTAGKIPYFLKIILKLQIGSAFSQHGLLYENITIHVVGLLIFTEENVIGISSANFCDATAFERCLCFIMPDTFKSSMVI